MKHEIPILIGVCIVLAIIPAIWLFTVLDPIKYNDKIWDNKLDLFYYQKYAATLEPIPNDFNYPSVVHPLIHIIGFFTNGDYWSATYIYTIIIYVALFLTMYYFAKIKFGEKAALLSILVSFAMGAAPYIFFYFGVLNQMTATLFLLITMIGIEKNNKWLIILSGIGIFFSHKIILFIWALVLLFLYPKRKWLIPVVILGIIAVVLRFHTYLNYILTFGAFGFQFVDLSKFIGEINLVFLALMFFICIRKKILAKNDKWLFLFLTFIMIVLVCFFGYNTVLTGAVNRLYATFVFMFAPFGAMGLLKYFKPKVILPVIYMLAALNFNLLFIYGTGEIANILYWAVVLIPLSLLTSIIIIEIRGKDGQ